MLPLYHGNNCVVVELSLKLNEKVELKTAVIASENNPLIKRLWRKQECTVLFGSKALPSSLYVKLSWYPVMPMYLCNREVLICCLVGDHLLLRDFGASGMSVTCAFTTLDIPSFIMSNLLI